MTFVSKGMAQISGKSHLCNVKYGKLYDGEQQVLVFLKVLWYANKCIVTDFRIHLFSGERKYFCIKRDGSKFGKIAICNVKYGKLYDGEQHVLVFLKVLWYANKCIVTDFEFIFSLVKKMNFVSKRMAQNSGKSHLCNVKYGKLYDGELLVFLKVLNAKCIVMILEFIFSLVKKFKRDGPKFAPLQCKIW